MNDGLFAWREALTVGRNVAAALLCLEGLLLGLIPAYLLWIITRWLRAFLPQARQGLRRFAALLTEWSAVIERVLAGIRAPFVWLIRTRARLDAKLASIRGSLE